MRQTIRSRLFPTAATNRPHEIQKFSRMVLDPVLIVWLWLVRNQVWQLVLPDRVTKVLHERVLQNSPDCRSSSHKVFRPKSKPECRAGAAGSAYCGVHTRFGDEDSHRRVARTRKDLFRKGQRGHWPSG